MLPDHLDVAAHLERELLRLIERRGRRRVDVERDRALVDRRLVHVVGVLHQLGHRDRAPHEGADHEQHARRRRGHEGHQTAPLGHGPFRQRPPTGGRRSRPGYGERQARRASSRPAWEADEAIEQLVLASLELPDGSPRPRPGGEPWRRRAAGLRCSRSASGVSETSARRRVSSASSASAASCSSTTRSSSRSVRRRSASSRQATFDRARDTPSSVRSDTRSLVHARPAQSGVPLPDRRRPDAPRRRSWPSSGAGRSSSSRWPSRASRPSRSPPGAWRSGASPSSSSAALTGARPAPARPALLAGGGLRRHRRDGPAVHPAGLGRAARSPPALTSVAQSTTALFTALFAAVLLDERLRSRPDRRALPRPGRRRGRRRARARAT